MTGIIKVDTIQNNGGTTALTIDSSGNISTTGHVNQGKVYLCSARWDGSSTSTLDSVDVFTVYSISSGTVGNGSNRVIYSDDYNMLNASTGIITIPADGVWLVNGIYAGNNSSEQRNIGRLWINDVNYGEWIETNGIYEDVSVTRIFKLEQNDTVRFGRHSSYPYDAFGFEIARIG